MHEERKWTKDASAAILPAVVQIFGRRAWSLSRLVDRALPRVASERSGAGRSPAGHEESEQAMKA